MGSISNAMTAGEDTCFLEMGIEKTAFLGAAVSGAKLLSRGAMALGRMTGQAATKVKPSKINFKVLGGSKPKNLIGPVRNPQGPTRPNLSKGQFMRNGNVMQSGSLTGMKGKAVLTGIAGSYGAGKGINYLHNQSNGQNYGRFNRGTHRKSYYG